MKKVDPDGMKISGDGGYMMYPILSYIGKAPKTAREISRAMLISRASVYRYLRQLEKMKMVTQRIDRKWVPLVNVKFERPNAPEVPIEEERLPKFKPAEPKEKPFEPKPTRRDLDIPEHALKIARHFNVPPNLATKIVGIGKVERCKSCTRTTPLKYGGIPTCPICSRKDLRE